MNNLILVRHGQSKFNLERRFTGFYDVDLTSKGKTEAKYAGELIKKLDIKFDAYFTSELKRASNTLNIILKVLNVSNAKINKAWELNERHYGGLTGLNKDETIKKYGIDQVKIWRRSFDTPPPKMEPGHPFKKEIKSEISGESLKDTFERVMPYFDRKIKLKNIKKNDLIFWKGHVAIALSKHKLIHAYGPRKKTLEMSIKKTINRIYKTANLKVTGIRRIP